MELIPIVVHDSADRGRCNNLPADRLIAVRQAHNFSVKPTKPRHTGFGQTVRCVASYGLTTSNGRAGSGPIKLRTSRVLPSFSVTVV